jgi:ParB family chromosome partitioning protein
MPKTHPQNSSKVLFLQVNQLQPNPFQPRSKIVEDEKFQELVQSVKTHGVLEPLLVVETPAGIHIIAGERRWRAAKKNHLEKIPVHMVKTSPKGMLEMAIIENVQRVNLSSLERAQALKRLLSEFNYTQEELGQRLGKSRQYVQCSLMMLDLPDPIKDGLNKGLITEGHARAILGAGSEKDMMECYRTIIAEDASVRRAEALSRFKRRQKEIKDLQKRGITKTPPLFNVDNYVKQLESNWSKRLVSQTSVALSDTSRGTKITILLKGDPQSRQKDVEKIIKIAGNKK